MADDNNQRPYRTSDMRTTPPANPAGGNDPLAELARLIGQSDPFAEFGRDKTRRVAPSDQPQNWQAPPTAPAAEPRPSPAGPYAANPAQSDIPPTQGFGSPNYQQPGYDAFAFNSGAGLYRTTSEAPVAPQGEEYAGDAYYRDGQAAEDEDIYDDMPPPRRRIGIVAIAAVFALAIVGTAGAFGYRALFGSSGTRAPPPVIKADNSPIKVVPSAASKDPQSSKMITDRVGDRQAERLVPREEQPLDTAAMQTAAGQAAQSSPLAPANGSGVVTSEPKKIHTITIRPEQVGMADTGASAPVPAAAPIQAPAPRAEIPPPPPPPPRPAPPPARAANVPPVVAQTNPEPAPAPEPRPAPVARAASPAPPPSPQRTAANNNTPLSLNPDAAPARASAPARAPAPAAAPIRAAPATASGGGYAVQVSAQRSEAEAQAAFRSMQAKYPSQLGNREPIIRRVDLGQKGIYFRAMVGPFASGSEANEVCSSLKSAGGQCIIQKI
jgi:hypothetical protein